ncbi:MAG: exopolysaccharide biosynthesis protein [Haliea sp.]|nr:exopolysaccharide biosynthesis protein [Haliea sp.]|tara:strand:+ start:920 stop:1510 length:591 start_codon:yes stop_codon:yes gene_type:complete
MTDDAAKNLEQLLEQIETAARREHSRVTTGEILRAVGSRSFAPVLMLTGALVTSPLSGIPLFPTTMAIIVLLVSLQMLVGHRHFWLPRWLLARNLGRDTLLRVLQRLYTPASLIDRVLKPRMTYLVKGPSHLLIALICLGIALTMPAMELIPFSSSIAGAALCAYGLALVSRDGLLALIAHSLVAMMVLGLVALSA